MNTTLWVLTILAFLPYVLAGMGGYYKTNEFGDMDMSYPRAQSHQLTGIGARCWAAQQNAWENLALFATTVLVCFAAGADLATLSTGALVFLGARIAHVVCYLADLAYPRSITQLAAIGAAGYMISQVA